MRKASRHLLATIAYRFQKSIHDAPTDFDSFQAGNGVRTPNEIVNHMSSVLYFAKNVLIENAERKKPEILSWGKEIERFHALLQDLDDLFVRMELTTLTYNRLIQGPLTDVLTHIGQIAMLRRLQGTPIKGENFSIADIQTGKVGRQINNE